MDVWEFCGSLDSSEHYIWRFTMLLDGFLSVELEESSKKAAVQLIAHGGQ